MQPAVYNLAFLQGAITELDLYLRSKELLWPLSARPPRGSKAGFPRLTLGNVLLTLDELEVQRSDLSENQRLELEEIVHQLNNHIAVQPIAIETKALREMRTRLNLWDVYVEEAVEGRGRSEYSQQVRNRVMLQRLTALTVSTQEATEILQQSDLSDNSIRAHFLEGEFIWDAALSSQYEPALYWYLYGSIS